MLIPQPLRGFAAVAGRISDAGGQVTSARAVAPQPRLQSGLRLGIRDAALTLTRACTSARLTFTPTNSGHGDQTKPDISDTAPATRARMRNPEENRKSETRDTLHPSPVTLPA